MSQAWSWFIVSLVALNIFGCVWLLWWTGKRRPGDPAPTDTSHIWDGDLTEYNKPMPRWWINLFYLTVVFAIGYLIYYPGLGTFAGVSQWTSANEQAREQMRETQKLETAFAPYKGQSIDVIAQDPKGLALGRSIFNNTCAACHGSSAQGAVGYPNLRDDIWHWGGSPDRILQTVLDGREGVMPAWGQILTGMGGTDAVEQVIAYVRTLSASKSASAHDEEAAAKGQKLYASVCVACHGVDGKGNQGLGAPDLTDDYWLYGSGDEALHKTIAEGRHGTMPAHRPILGETRARLAAAYVWSLSHPGKPSAASQ